MSDDENTTDYWVPRDLDANPNEKFGIPFSDIAIMVLFSGFLPLAAVAWLPFEIPLWGLIVLLVVGVTISMILFSLTPEDESIVSSSKWFFAYIRRSSEVANESRAKDTGRSVGADWIDPDRQNFWEIKQRSQDIPLIKSVYPDANVIERKDGAYYGMLRVSGVNATMLGESERKALTSSFAASLNDNEYPFQVFITTEEFAFKEHQEHYESRQSDPDVRNNPILDTLLRSYRNKVLGTTATQGTKQRVFYIVIPVEESELSLHGGQKRLWDQIAFKLNDVPVLGSVFSATGPTEYETHVAQVTEVSRRVEEFGTSIQNISGIDTQRVSAETAATLLNEFWTGQQYTRGSPFDNTTTEGGTTGQSLRREVVVASDSRDGTQDE